MKPVNQIARRIGLALITLFCGVGTSACMAAPLVLHGTATIATVHDDFVFQGTIPRLPFAAHVGDTFPFTLAVQSQTPAPNKPSGHATFQATIGVVQLQHSQLDVYVSNNQGVKWLALAEPGDYDTLAIVGDSISIRQPDSASATEYLGAANLAGAPRFRVELGFLEYVLTTFPQELQTYPAILNSLTIPQDAETWQAFSNREFLLWFDNGTFVGVHINGINAVPEPLTLSMLGWCCTPWLGRRLTRRTPPLLPSK
jgi:hypothetical protein